ncbi:MAG: hypothetical protein K0U41_05425 [Gammaproteobacteria bacterium]|nr:hypothetical protein [Gammaproteobacteria bacterium]
MANRSTGRFRTFYTGNQVGCFNQVGPLNFVAGGPPGSGISSGTTYQQFFQSVVNRNIWETPTAELDQSLLDISFPFIDLRWIAEVELGPSKTFYISNRNVYVEDIQGNPRYYEARALKSPSINITAGEWLAPNFEIGDLKLRLNNRDGYFNQWLPQGEDYTQWMGSNVRVLVGFGEKRSNYFEVFNGFISSKKGVETTLEEVKISCYDRADNDEKEIPTLIYDRTNYPQVNDEDIGSPLPIIYGDYNSDVSEFGDIGAICSNANEDSAQLYIWNISENALREINEVFLHRGSRTEDDQTPIRLKDTVISKQLDRGRIIIPANVPVLEEFYPIIDGGRPGATTTAGEIAAESADQNFINLGVKVGDLVYLEGITTEYTVSSVTASNVQTNIPSILTDNNSYRILTDRYSFISGDRISVKCKGKNTEILSTTRITDSGVMDIEPTCLTIGLNRDYWIANNGNQKIYNISFGGTLIKEVDYSSISSEITEITGLDIQVDNTLWIFDRPRSSFYRYVVADGGLGMSFSTSQVQGLQSALQRGGPICIDDGNIISVHDQVTGNFHRINPFAGASAGLVSSFNKSAFAATADDIVDITCDINQNQLVILDRATESVYRINDTTGVLVSSFNASDRVAPNFNQGRGIAYYIDGTIFLMNNQDLSIYNFNEFQDASENPGFIARDLLQAYAGKNTFDFDLKWNETCRGTLSDYKARIVIDQETTVITYLNSMMQAYNCSMYQNFSKYSLFQIDFENFTTAGLPIREGDIKLGTFNPQKEHNQYFNLGTGTYRRRPFNGTSLSSDNYLSPTGAQFAGREIKKTLDLFPIYRRTDVDRVMPLFVRIAAAEPEFVNLTVGFRFLFAQLNTFYNINFTDAFRAGKSSGRRFNNIPSFVRKIQMNLDSMEISLKLWSLGTTQFGGFKPVGPISGGEDENIILTNLGTLGTISPRGIITGSTANSLTIEGIGSDSAENKTSNLAGKAWLPDFQVGIYSGADHTLVETAQIESVSGSTITFTENLTTTIQNTVKNSAGFTTGGHYIKYTTFLKSDQSQININCYFGRPIQGYPTSSTQEVEEQRGGNHNFENGRIPYVLYPLAFTPA